MAGSRFGQPELARRAQGETLPDCRRGRTVDLDQGARRTPPKVPIDLAGGVGHGLNNPAKRRPMRRKSKNLHVKAASPNRAAAAWHREPFRFDGDFVFHAGLGWRTPQSDCANRVQRRRMAGGETTQFDRANPREWPSVGIGSGKLSPPMTTSDCTSTPRLMSSAH